MTHKKVSNADAGTSVKFGGNDLDKWSDFASGVDVDDYDINSDFTVRSGKRHLRNPANTFSYDELGSAIVANRTVTEPLLTANDTRVYQAHTQTLTGKTIDITTNTLKNLSSLAYFVVYLDAGDSLYKCLNTRTGVVVSSNSNPTVVIQYAIDNLTLTAKSIFIKAGTYLLTTNINCVDKEFLLMGERAATGGGGGRAGDTILSANYTDASGAVFNCHNTIKTLQQFKNIVIQGNLTVKYIIDMFDARQNWPIFENVALFDPSDTCLVMEKVQQSCVINLSLRDAPTCALLLNGSSSIDKINTLYFYGGQISYSGCNVRVTGSLTDVAFNGMMMENNHATTSFTNSIDLQANACHGIRFRDCAFEFDADIPRTVVKDGSNNSSFDNCRFNSDFEDWTAIQYTSTARNCKFINNTFHANQAATTAIIQIDSGASGIRIIDNTQATNTPMTVNLRDSGTNTIRLGNSFCSDSYVRSCISGLVGRRSGRVFIGQGLCREGLCTAWTEAGSAGYRRTIYSSRYAAPSKVVDSSNRRR